MSVKGSKDINKFSILELKILNNLFVNHPSSHRLRTKNLISSCLLSLRQRTGRKNPKVVLGAGRRWRLGLGGAAVWGGPGLDLAAAWGGCLVIGWACAGRRWRLVLGRATAVWRRLHGGGFVVIKRPVVGGDGGWALAGQGGGDVVAAAAWPRPAHLLSHSRQLGCLLR
jgi:hypothetical protein